MTDDPFSAFAAAWRVSLVATSLLFLAMAIAPLWDAGIYASALKQALVQDHY